MAHVAGIWRYPVKSMLGEALTEAPLGPDGLVGDRAYALVDVETGQVASAKHPRKWGVLMSCRAAFVDGAEPGAPVSMVLPDGRSLRSDDPGADAVLSDLVGRQVRLASAAPDDRAFEEVWPDIEGLAPEQVIAATNVGLDDGERVSRLPLGAMAPEGTFFDLATVHLLTTGTLDHLRRLAPSATFDARRYRPNVLVDSADEEGFVENAWVGRTVALGDPRVAVTMVTMRCVMTTLAQDDLPRDRETLRAIAEHNRVEIPGFGTWACAGVYGSVAAEGVLKVGAPASLSEA